MIAVSRCCGYWGMCQTQVTWRCRQRSPSSCCVSFVACWTQWGGGLQGRGGTGDVPSLKEEMSWLAEVCQDPNTQCGLEMAAHGWGVAAGRMEPGAQRLGWASSVPLTVVVGSFVEPLDENIDWRWKAKITSVLWGCDTITIQWRCPKNG